MIPISRQEKIDKVMCKPGYTWNPVVGRCLMGGIERDRTEPHQPKPSTPTQPEVPAMPTPDQAVKQERAARAANGKSVK